MGFQYETEDLSRLSSSFASHRRDPFGVEAFGYYGSYGLADPKAPFVDAPATASALGIGYFGGLMVAVLTGFLVAGTIGWILDPAHKHSRGVDEWFIDDEGEYTDHHLPGGSWGSYQEQPSDMGW